MKDTELVERKESRIREFWAKKTLKYLFAYEVAPLCKSLKENGENKLHFISDREVTTTGGKVNFDCDKIFKRVKKQLTAYGKIIEEINGFEDSVVDEDVQQEIRYMVAPLKDYAIKFGYCKEATELLKIMTNPKLVGKDFADISISADILAVLDAYGKRAILESKLAEYKDEADQLSVDVGMGFFGKKASGELSQQKMEQAFVCATVVRGDMVFKTDGTHEWKPSKDKA